MSEQDSAGNGDEEPTRLQDSNPNAGGAARAAGDLGVSSERTGPQGSGHVGTDGERDTSAPVAHDQTGDQVGSDAEREPGTEDNPEGIPPKAGYPSKDPRSDELPYKDA
jgi:hypothetical protein